MVASNGAARSKPIGFENEEDWLDYRPENHPEFLRRIAVARKALREGRGVRMEDLENGGAG